MSKIQDKINDALGIDIDKVIDDAENQDIETDAAAIEKYNQRKEVIEKLKQDLKDARSLQNKDWAEAMLKNSAEKIAVTQEIFTQEIEDDPVSKNITAHSELANALVNTVKAVHDLDMEEEKLKLSKEKNQLRRAELEGDGGTLLNAQNNDKVIGVGSNDDILRLMKSGIDPSDPKGEKHAETKEG
jgi:hypothetical protein